MHMARNTLVVGAVAVALLGGAVALANSSDGSNSAEFAYSAFSRPQTNADRAAIAQYKGDSSQVSLATARLLGRDADGDQYFAVRDSHQTCFVVVESAYSSSEACNALGKDAKEVPWLKISDKNGVRLAIMVPDGYSTDAIKGSPEHQLLSESNLVVLRSSSLSAQEVIKIPSRAGHPAVVVNTAGR